MGTDNRVIIFDTTLRDGEQAPGCSTNLKEKLEIAAQLARLGVDVIEAGFPIASDGDFESVRAVAERIEVTDEMADWALRAARRRSQTRAAGRPARRKNPVAGNDQNDQQHHHQNVQGYLR